MTNSFVDIGREWDKQIVPVLRASSIGRKLIPLNAKLSGKGIGQTSVKTFGYGASAAAITDYNLVSMMEDSVSVSDLSVQIPIQQDSIKIPRRTWEAMIQGGYTPQADQAVDMASKLSLELDQLIIDGWKPDGTNYEIKGLFQIAGNSTAGADFATAGNAIVSVGTLLGMLQDDGIFSEGYNLTLATTQYQQLLGSTLTNGNSEFERVRQILNVDAPQGTMPGRIFQSSILTAATGIITPVATEGNMRFFDLVEAQQPKNYLSYEGGDMDLGDILLKQVGACVPRFKHVSSSVDNAVGKFTAI